MTEAHVLERLTAANPEAEVWWDSSPLVYRSWRRQMVDAAPEAQRKELDRQLRGLFDAERPDRMVFRGVTTNPPLSFNAIKDDPTFWAGYVRERMVEHPDAGVEEIYWITYKDIVRRGAEAMRPLWDQSEHRHGYVSGQVDPRSVFDKEAMLAQAFEIADIAPNVMVKVPGTAEGYEVIEELSARGIATNNTLSFVVPQFVACMDAVERGLARAKQNGVELFRFRSVITHMTKRFGVLGDLAAQAAARGIELSEEDTRWAEIALFKRAYQLACDRNYPGKMLMCSMVLGPKSQGDATSWHVEKVAGADIVYTCPPGYITALMGIDARMAPFRSDAIDEPPPAATMEKLQRIPYFVEAYEPDGMAAADFNHHGALLATATQFSAATRGMVDFVTQQFQEAGRY